MRLKFCVACGSKDDLQHHRLVMRSEGGGNEETNLITLCFGCHAKLHERRIDGAYNASERITAGIAAAKARGIRMGRKSHAEARPDLVALAKALARKKPKRLSLRHLRRGCRSWFSQRARPAVQSQVGRERAGEPLGPIMVCAAHRPERKETQMDITPSPAFCAACRIVLGGDTPDRALRTELRRAIERVHRDIVDGRRAVVLPLDPPAGAQPPDPAMLLTIQQAAEEG